MVGRLQKKKTLKKRKEKDVDLMALQENLLQFLGSKVVISGSRNKGAIKIFYFSLDDLNRIFEKITE